MADYTQNVLKAAIHALSEVVAPSVDPDDPLAVEQLNLVIAWLEFERDRYPRSHDLHRAGVRWQRGIAEAALAAVGPTHGRDLSDRIARADRVLAEPEAGEPQLRAAEQDLAAGVSDLVRAADAFGPDSARALERAVIAASENYLTGHRVWLQPLGVEAGATDLPPLDDVLLGACEDKQ
ncbi:MAG: hypothetical protein VX874_09445 [Pseudomonadota bacterium]|nr:hypothetical protein [Pseudomonadota bacterium]